MIISPSPQVLQRIRDEIVTESFGGPRTYALLKARNPEIAMLLNAGIVHGLQEKERDDQTA